MYEGLEEALRLSWIAACSNRGAAWVSEEGWNMEHGTWNARPMIMSILAVCLVLERSGLAGQRAMPMRLMKFGSSNCGIAKMQKNLY